MDKFEQQIVDYIDEHRNELIKLLQDIVKIPSITGSEKKIQEFVFEKISALGLDTKFLESDVKKMFEMFPEVAQIPSIGEPGLDMPLMTDDKFTYSQLIASEYDRLKSYKDRPNVIGVLKGKRKGKSLIVNGHIDTVPIGDESKWTHDPFGAEIKGGKLYGRGAVDMKGGVAAMLGAVEALIKLGIPLSGDLIFQTVVNEEHAGGGTLGCVAAGIKADAAIVAEPSGPGQVVLDGSGGGVYWEITIKGKEVHAGSRWRDGKQYGISAVEKAALVLESLINLEKTLNKNEILMSMCAGKIHGGTYSTATALECIINGVAYFSPNLGTGKEGIIKVKKLLKDAVSKIDDPWLNENPPVIKFQHYDDAFKLPENIWEIRELVTTSISDVLGRKAEISVLNGGCDARHLYNQGNIPVVVYGPGDVSLAHSTDEYIGIDDYIDGMKVIAVAIYRWCK